MKSVWSLFVSIVVLAGAASADPLAAAYTNGPDSSVFPINLTFENLPASTADITSIVLDGSTGAFFPIVWDSVAPVGGTASSALISTLGVDTQVVTFNFGGDGFNPGENFTLTGVDPDPVGNPDGGVTIGQLLGTTIQFNFTGGGSLIGTFVDNPAEGAGLVWRESGRVPEPAMLCLVALGMGAVALRRRRAHAKVAA